jgi:hypothetical protein
MAFQKEEVPYGKHHDVGYPKRACPFDNHRSLFLHRDMVRGSKLFMCCV